MKSIFLVPLVALLGTALVACTDSSGPPTALEIPIDRLEFVSFCQGVFIGRTCQLEVDAFTAEGQRIANPVLSWTSSNGSVATVNEEGVVRGQSIGTVMIEVSNSTGTTSARTTVRVFELNPK